MLNPKFTTDTPFPYSGSIGFYRGTAERYRILQRDPGGSCLVKRLDELPTIASDRIASGNTRIPEADLYPTEELARWCGRPPRATRARRARKPRK